MSVTKFVTFPNGSCLKPLNAFRKHEKRFAIELRKLSRKVKFSANWHMQKPKPSKLLSRITNCRNDYQHKSSCTISKNHAMVAIEDLRAPNMSKSAKGNVEEHGKNVKEKSGLNKSILDQGWYEFRRRLEYKQLWNGGIVSKENRQSQAHFECIKCGHTNNTDVVGTLNVLEREHCLLVEDVNFS